MGSGSCGAWGPSSEDLSQMPPWGDRQGEGGEMDKGSVDGSPSDAASGLEISESPAGVRERVEGGLEGCGRPSHGDSCCQEDRSSSGSLFPDSGAHCPRKDRPGGLGGPGHPCFKQFQPGALPAEQGSGTPPASYWGDGAPYNRPRRAPGPLRPQAWGEEGLSRLHGDLRPWGGGGPRGPVAYPQAFFTSQAARRAQAFSTSPLSPV